MKKIALLILPVLILASCCPAVTVIVTNGTDSDRLPEMVELCSEQISGALDLKDGESFIIRNEAGEEQPYQITSDAKVIFQVEMKAGESGTYTITKGQPSEYQTYACGRHYPERLDDFAWENDLVGFRAYGPALQAKGERGFGYDLFAKRGTDLPVIGKFYELNSGERNRSIYNELKQSDPQAAEDFLIEQAGNGQRQTCTLSVAHAVEVYVSILTAYPCAGNKVGCKRHEPTIGIIVGRTGLASHRSLYVVSISHADTGTRIDNAAQYRQYTTISL